MQQKTKHIYTVTYTNKKKYSSEVASQIFARAREHEPTGENKHIVLEKHYHDNRGNSVMELYKEDLSAEDQDLYNRFYAMVRNNELNDVLIREYCDCWYSDREIQDLFSVLRESL